MRTKILACLLLACLMLTDAARAQDTNKVYTSPDGTFTFVYPFDWYVTPPVSGYDPLSTRIVLSNLPGEQYEDSPDGVQILIAFPQKRAYYGHIGGGTTPAAIVTNSVKSTQAMAPLTFGTPPADGTPELLDLQPAVVPLTEFTVNGHPAARFIDANITLGLNSGYMAVVLDVGNDYLVSLVANSPKGGMDVVKRYEVVIIAIAESVRYAPKAVYSGDPDLPQVYAGPIGIWQRGSGRFFYPANWIVFTFGTQIIQKAQ